jgi:hypothetical protein
MWKMVSRLGFKGGRAMEPSAGSKPKPKSQAPTPSPAPELPPEKNAQAFNSLLGDYGINRTPVTTKPAAA